MGVNSGEDQVNMSEVLKERLYFAPLPRVEDTAGVVQCLPKRATCFSTDSELVSRIPSSSCSVQQNKKTKENMCSHVVYLLN
jgi:hypothetical protein